MSEANGIEQALSEAVSGTPVGGYDDTFYVADGSGLVMTTAEVKSTLVKVLERILDEDACPEATSLMGAILRAKSKFSLAFGAEFGDGAMTIAAAIDGEKLPLGNAITCFMRGEHKVKLLTPEGNQDFTHAVSRGKYKPNNRGVKPQVPAVDEPSAVSTARAVGSVVCNAEVRLYAQLTVANRRTLLAQGIDVPGRNVTTFTGKGFWVVECVLKEGGSPSGIHEALRRLTRVTSEDKDVSAMAGTVFLTRRDEVRTLMDSLGIRAEYDEAEFAVADDNDKPDGIRFVKLDLSAHASRVREHLRTFSTLPRIIQACTGIGRTEAERLVVGAFDEGLSQPGNLNVA